VSSWMVKCKSGNTDDDVVMWEYDSYVKVVLRVFKC
jgi:hypothetical protein